ncbi:hypothetical protein SAMN05216366_10568 [Selenomonas ruminantium]|uniref:Uncharacterized protein n=1 Tax=Selenomonas ruminantium TaxID=971 RepID=A0A1H0PJD0_SELRU|nr:hypothetical protein SAMN05216366_10568 [Selenomonas ruminantium]
MFYDTKNLDGNSFIPAEDYCEFDSAEDLLEKAYFFLRDEKEHMVIAKYGRKNNERYSLHNRIIDLLASLQMK